MKKLTKAITAVAIAGVAFTFTFRDYPYRWNKSYRPDNVRIQQRPPARKPVVRAYYHSQYMQSYTPVKVQSCDRSNPDTKAPVCR